MTRARPCPTRAPMKPTAPATPETFRTQVLDETIGLAAARWPALWLGLPAKSNRRFGRSHSRQKHEDQSVAMRTGYLAFLGFALSFLFLLAIVAFAFMVTSGINDAPSLAETMAK